MSPGWLTRIAPFGVSTSTVPGWPLKAERGAGADANRALGQAELGDVVGERRKRHICAVAQADSEARGLQLAQGVVVDVNAVSTGEGIVDFGLGEDVDAVWLERDVALNHRDASDSVGWVAVIVLRAEERASAEEKDRR